jgi:hypothetical protein
MKAADALIVRSAPPVELPDHYEVTVWMYFSEWINSPVDGTPSSKR